MKTKLLIVILVGVGILMFIGCNVFNNNEEISDYPVEFVNTVIDEQPQKIVVLDDNLADIIIASGYIDKIVAKSSSCTQGELNGVKSLGENIDAEDIIGLNADLVFASDSLNQEIYDELRKNNIDVLRIVNPNKQEEIVALYQNIGRIMSGNITGAIKGTDAITKLSNDIRYMQLSVFENGELPTVCYLYNIDGKTVTSDTYGDTILKSALVSNVASELENEVITYSELLDANPMYILCPKEVKEEIENDVRYKTLDAVKNGDIIEIPQSYLTRQGYTSVEAIHQINSIVYEKMTTPKLPKPDGDVAKDYNIEIKEDDVVKEGDSSDMVSAIQKRLKDLGYWNDIEITGYYGQLTQIAVNTFKEHNMLESQGEQGLTSNDLKVLFSSSAIELIL